MSTQPVPGCGGADESVAVPETNEANDRRSATVPVGFLMRFVLVAGCGSLLALSVAHGFWHLRDFRACCVGVGFLWAAIGSGVGTWAALRLRSLKLFLSSLPVILALVGWIWLMHRHL
jgi:hypothetical protein